jgi:hypothetical protein
MANFTLTQNAQVAKEIISLTTYGNIYDDSGCKWDGEPTNIWADWGDVSGHYYKGYMEWDISEIKHVSTIDEVWFIASIYKASGVAQLCGIRGGQPSTASCSNLLSWVNSSTTYAYGDWTTEEYLPYFTKDLGSTAAAHMQADIAGTTDFFAIALRLWEESSTTDDQMWIRGSSRYAEPEAMLYVIYTVNNVVTLTQPSSIDRVNKRNIEGHYFKSGKYANRDIGGEGKTIRMSGIEWDSGSETSMSYIDDMADLGKSIVLSGFADASLNDTWLIDEFRWRKEEGTDDVFYSWELTLVKESG